MWAENRPGWLTLSQSEFSAAAVLSRVLRSRRALLLASAVLTMAPAAALAGTGPVITGAGAVNITLTNPITTSPPAPSEGLVTISSGNAVNVTDKTSITAASSIGVLIGAKNASTLTVTAGSSISGQTGVDASTHSDLGSFNSNGAAGGLTVTNAGTITGTGGAAILFGTGDDTLALQTGSVINGQVDGGAGANGVTLAGTTNTQTATQSVGGYLNFQTLNVNSGYWTLAAGGTYPTVGIAGGAALEVDDLGATSNGGLVFTTLTDAGTLAIDTATSLTEAGTITGAGDLKILGGAVTLSGTSSVGATEVAGGTLIATGPLTSVFTVDSGATLQGSTTTLLAQGTVADNGTLVFDQATTGSFNNAIAGTGSIIKQNAGTLTLGGTSSVSLTTVAAGTLIVTGPLTSGFAVDTGATLQGNSASLLGAVTDNGTLVFDQATAGSFANAITGSGAIIKQNAGTLTLGGASSVALTTVAAGTLIVTGPLTSSFAIDNGATLQGNTSSLLAQGGVTDNGTLVFDQAATGSFANAITGAGAIIKQNTGALTLSGTSSVGSTTVAGGTLIVTGPLTSAFTVNSGATLQGNSASLLAQGAVTDNGTLVFDQAATGSFGNAITGTGSIVKQNAGALTLSGTSSVASTTVAGGALIVTGPLTSAFTVNSGATLQGNSASLLGAVTDNGSLVFDQAANGSFNSAITGAGTITKQNTGALTLAGVSSVASTTVAGGSLIVTGSLAGGVTVNSGATFQLGAGGAAGAISGALVDNGTVVVDRSDNYTIAGAFSGAGSLVDNDPNTLTFSGPYSFSGATAVNGGGAIDIGQLAPNAVLDLTSGTINLTGTSSSIASLNGTGGTVNIGAGDTASIGSGDFGGVISGPGALDKVGPGLLDLTGVDSVGSTVVVGGELQIDGTLTSPVTVDSGAMLKGSGTIVGQVTLESGGEFAPGDPVTINVHGAVTFDTGSTYLVQTTSAGVHDLINVTGGVTIHPGASVLVDPLGLATAYGRVSNYTIVAATTGVAGTFSGVTSDAPLLTPHLSYTADAVELTLTRNDITLASLGATPNQIATAAAIDAAGVTSTLNQALAVETTAGAQQGFDALSGEMFASLPTILIAQADQVRRTLTNRMALGSGSGGVWGEAIGSWSSFDGSAGVAGARGQVGGATIGVDNVLGGWRVGIAGTYEQDAITIAQRQSRAADDATGVSLYAGNHAGPIAVDLGASYAWHRLNTERSELFPGFADHTSAGFNAGAAQAFAEIGYDAKFRTGTIGPFAGVSYDEVTTGAAHETGGPAALNVAGQTRELLSARVGLRGATSFGGEDDAIFQLHAAVDWRYAADVRTSATRVAFEDTGEAFAVSGLPIAKDAGEVTAGVSAKVGPRSKLDLSYTGDYASRSQEQAVKLMASWAF